MRIHYAGIRSHTRESERKVLEFDLGHEWGPLCELLEVGLADHAYPRENEGADWILSMREWAPVRAKAAVLGFLRACFPIGVWGMAVKFLRFYLLGAFGLRLLSSRVCESSPEPSNA